MNSPVSYRPDGPLANKTLLCVTPSMFVTTDLDVQHSVWFKLKKEGLKSLCVVVDKSEVNHYWCEKIKAMGIIDEFNADGLTHETEDDRPVEEISTGIITWLNKKNIQVNAASFFGDFSCMVGGFLCEQLGIPGDSYNSTKVAYLKDATHEYVLNSTRAAKYGVHHSYPVHTEKEVLAALENLTFPVVMKPVCGSISVGCKLLNNTPDCLEFFNELSVGLASGTATCKKLAYSQSVIVMEFLQGNFYDIDVVISQGKLVGGTVTGTGPFPLPEFWYSTHFIPGVDSEKEHTDLVNAAYQCCLAVGLRHGVYNVEFIRDNSEAVPKLIEINPRPGLCFINAFVNAAYGFDTRLTNAQLRCGADISQNEMKIETKAHVASYTFYLGRNREKLNTAFGHMLSNAKDYDVKMLNLGEKTMTELMYENSSASINFYPTLTVITSDQSRAGAITKLCRFLVDSKCFESMEEASLGFCISK